MKSCKKIISWLVSALMVIGAIYVNPIEVRAAAKTVTLKLSCASDMEIPGNYGIDYETFDAGGSSTGNGALSGSGDGSEVTDSVSVPDGGKVRIQVRSAGNDIFYNGRAENSWGSTQEIAYDDLLAEYSFQLQPGNPGGPGPGPEGPGGDPSGNDPGHGPETINLTVTWSADVGDLQVGGFRASDSSNGQETFTRAYIESDDTIKISIQAPFLEDYNSIKLNGEERFAGPMPEGKYIFFIPKTETSLSIVATKVATSRHTIVWAYDDSMGDDAMVENGRVEVIDGVVENNPGHCIVEEDAVVTIKLIPDYGYQVVGARINGDVDLTAGSESNVFTFEMPHTNVHFQGIFTRTEDIVANSASAVSDADFDGSKVATSGGTAKMTIADATPSDISAVSGVIDTSRSVQAVDITMDQLFYKNSATDVWSTSRPELSSSAAVALVVNQDAAGYAVLRSHNGVVEEIEAIYDSETHTIIFASDRYSTYTLVPLAESNNGPIESIPSDSNSSSEDREESAPLMESTDFGGRTIATWGDLETVLLEEGLAARSESGAANEPIQLMITRQNAVIPASIFSAISRTEEVGIHLFVGSGTALTFMNDDNLTGQSAVNVFCDTIENENGRTIKFRGSDELVATSILHSTVPAGVNKVKIYFVDANGNKTMIMETAPTEEGRFCFPITKLGSYEVEYIR